MQYLNTPLRKYAHPGLEENNLAWACYYSWMRTMIQLTEAQLAQLLEVSPRRDNLLDAVRQPQAAPPPPAVVAKSQN